MDLITSEKITGKVVKVIFEGSGNFCIAKIKIDDEYFEVTVKGIMKLVVGNIYEFDGIYKEDDSYGEFFSVTSFKRPELKNGEEIVNYLASSQFEGIGKRTALKIYKAFGEETLDIIKTNPKMLLELGINEKIVDELCEKHGTDSLLSDLYELLAKHQFSDYLIQSIYGYLEENASGNKLKVFLDNPYLFIPKINGLTFLKVDEFYKANGGSEDFDDRLIALLVDIVSKHCYNTGDTYCEFETCKNSFIMQTSNQYDMDMVLNKAIEAKRIMFVNDNLSTTEFYSSEYGIARNMSLRMNSIIKKFDTTTIISEINKLENEFKINYSKVQKKAIVDALLNNVFIITGGPGTGKTTIIKAIVTIYHRLKYNDQSIKDISDKIILCAPTGRAAQRMKEATGYTAKTIHSLLGWEPADDTFFHNLENPLMQEVFVIDEFSMVDVFLAYSLLKAIRPQAIIIIVGDKAQLESVNPGNVLGDLLANENIKSAQLDIIYRQGEGSSIASLAKKIDINDKIELVNTNDMSVLSRSGDIVDVVKVIYEKSLTAGYDPMDVQILYPKYKGVNGIDNLNLNIKPELKKGAEHVIVRDITYQVGDKIMQLKNDTARDIYNGDIGVITKITDPNAKSNASMIEVKIRDKTVDVTRKQMDDITHSYAISIHKSQGSEFKVIILPITNESRNMLTKKLIYTAVTRTKDKLVILGDLNMFDIGINERDYQRKTNLQYFLNVHIKIEKSPLDFL